MKQYILFQDADDDVIGDIQKGCFGVISKLFGVATIFASLFILFKVGFFN